MNEVEKSSKSKNIGIEFLRIVAMFMIVVLHINGAGGLMSACKPLSFKYEMVQLLQALSFCSVNCFALISGYVSMGGRQKLEIDRMIGIYLHALFYSVLFTVLFFALGKADWKALIRSFFPVTSENYWYVSAYVGLLLVQPFLNRYLDHATFKEIRGIEIFVLLFSVYATISYPISGDPFSLKLGCSAFWLIILYLLGACLRRDDQLRDWIAEHYYLLATGCLGIMWLGTAAVEALTAKLFGTAYFGNVFLNYTSFPCVLLACALLAKLSGANVKSKVLSRNITAISPLAFGVYLIHVQPQVFNNWVTGGFAFLAKLSAPVMAAGILLAAIVVFAVCLPVEWLRQQLFRLCKIKSLCNTVDAQVHKGIDRLLGQEVQLNK